MESSSSDGDGSRGGGDHLQKKKRTEDETRPLMVDAALFDCPVCCEPLIPPIFQCKNGHLACSSCCPYLSYKCPVCDLPVGHNRCFGLERLLESARVPCRNAKFGCTESLSYGKESTHENECSFVIPPLTPRGPNARNGRGGFALGALHAPVPSNLRASPRARESSSPGDWRVGYLRNVSRKFKKTGARKGRKGRK